MHFANAFGKMIVCELDFVLEEFLCVFSMMSDTAGFDARIEEDGIEHEYEPEGGDAELTDFEDDVSTVHVVKKIALLFVWDEFDKFGSFVFYCV